MADALVTSLPELSASGLSGSDVMHIVDVSDTSDNAAGSSRKVSLDSVFQSRIPSAAELSVSGQFQNYIDECSTGNTHPQKNIYLPPGTITTSESLLINHSGVSLIGAGFNPSGEQGTLINTSASTGLRIDADGIECRGLSINSAGGGVGVSIISSDSSPRQNISIKNFGTTGFGTHLACEASGTTNIQVHNYIIDNGSAFNPDGINLTNCNNSLFNNITFGQITTPFKQGARNVSIQNCIAKDCNTFWLAANDGDNITGNIQNCRLERTIPSLRPKIIDTEDYNSPIHISASIVEIETLGTDRSSISDPSYTADFTGFVVYRLPDGFPGLESQISTDITIAPYGTELTPDSV